MEPPSLPPTAKPGTPVGLIVAGTLFILVWVALHCLIFVLGAAGGIVGEVLLTIFRGTQLPGTANESRPLLAWEPFFQTAVVLSGLSGVAAGTAIFLKEWRGRLLLAAAALFLLSLPVAFYAVWVLLKTSLLP